MEIYWLINSLLLVLAAIYCFHKYMSRNYDYWKKKNVFYFKPSPIFGNFLDLFLFRTTIGEYLCEKYNQTKESFFGLYVFDQPFIVIKNPEIIKSVLIKDFNHFMDRNVLSDPHDELSARMLFFNKNPDWKIIRTKISPIFTGGKLKNFIPHMNKIGENLKDYIDKIITNGSKEAREICAKYTTDVIAKCAYGFNANSFKNDKADFRRLGHKAYDLTWSNGIQQTSYFFLPNLANILRFKMFDNEVMTFLRNAFWEAIDYREKNNMKGNDLLDLIIELKQNKEFCEKFNFAGDKIVAQAAQFFLAGFETASSTMAFTLYELCLQPEIQQRLRKEIKTALKDDVELTHEIIQDMKYLHMVVSETLRKYPILPFLDRICNADYKIPGTEVTIEKGTPVFIPVLGLHYDAEYFPNPKVFDPERFSPENISSIPSCTYIPFGEGPRNCVGARFGLLNAKIGLIHILSKFKVERIPETPVPLRFEPKSFVLTSDIGFPMKFLRDFDL